MYDLLEFDLLKAIFTQRLSTIFTLAILFRQTTRQSSMNFFEKQITNHQILTFDMQSTHTYSLSGAIFL